MGQNYWEYRLSRWHVVHFVCDVFELSVWLQSHSTLLLSCPKILGSYASSIGLATVADSKRDKGDELPRYGPGCLCGIFFFFRRNRVRTVYIVYSFQGITTHIGETGANFVPRLYIPSPWSYLGRNFDIYLANKMVCYRWLYSALRVKRETCVLSIKGRCF